MIKLTLNKKKKSMQSKFNNSLFKNWCPLPQTSRLMFNKIHFSSLSFPLCNFHIPAGKYFLTT